MRWRSALKRLVRAAILLEVLYLLVANLLLWLPAFRRHLDAARPGFSIRFERAWTPLPGLVFVRNLDLARAGRVRQWSFHADRGWGFFDPFGLARRTIRFSHIAAEGLEIRVRARPLPNSAPEPERERLLPPLPGMTRTLPSTAALSHRRAWRFRVDDLTARDVREVWIDAVRFEGKATGEGGFTSRPRQSLQILPSEIRVASGSLLIGERLLASELVAELTGRGDELALPVCFASVAGGTRRRSTRLQRLPARTPGLGGELGQRTRVGTLRLALSAQLATHDVAQGRYSLAGTSMHLDEVTVRRGQEPEHRDGWWARIDLPAGELTPGQETYLTATLVAKLRDGAPLEALFSERRPLLGRLVAGLDTQGLGARGHVRVRKGGLDFDEVAVQYPHGSLAADLRFAGQGRSGRMLARWRRLALGLEFEGQERNWALKNAEAWWQGRRRQPPQ